MLAIRGDNMSNESNLKVDKSTAEDEDLKLAEIEAEGRAYH